VEKTVEKTVEKIIKLIQENPSVTTSELQKHTNLTRRGVEWQIKNLKEKGILKRIGPAKGGEWKIINI
jgi:ATP-dependent DNA helicase RecG